MLPARRERGASPSRTEPNVNTASLRRRLAAASLLLCTLIALAAPARAQSHPSADAEPGAGSNRAADAPPMSAEARAYLDIALDSIRATSMHGESVDWTAVRDSALLLAAGAERPSDTYGAIGWALGRVDRHSFLQFHRGDVNPRLLDGRVGYLRIPFYAGPVEAPLADTLQHALRTLEGAGACGWIVDLRMNGGGNVWPMQLGIAPLLGDSVIGVGMVDGVVTDRTLYVGGAAIMEEAGERTVVVSIDEPYVMRNPDAPVAVLIDNATGSSAEGIAIAFRPRPNTRFFGAATAGYSTINRGSRLPDGANMVVTIGAMADRTGRTYGDAIEPDEAIEMPKGWWPSPTDAVARRAAEWVADQPGCR